MSALERTFHEPAAQYPVLVTAALAHVQFETIHPFLDSNGRIGRLLIPLLLHHASILQQPLLYLSLYFKQHREEYYRLLDRVRAAGDWEAWLDFVLEGVATTATAPSTQRSGSLLYSKRTPHEYRRRGEGQRRCSGYYSRCSSDQ